MRSRPLQSLSVFVVAILGLAAYLVLQRPFTTLGPPPRLVLPSVYGVYALNRGQLIELEALTVRAPDQRIFMSAPIKGASRTDASVTENPEMLMFRPEDPEFAFPSGRYALVLKGHAFDFTIAGPITEPAHCLERTEAANGAFYSECRKP
jgi:hypothetical protein